MTDEVFQLWESATNVAFGANVASAFLDVHDYEKLIVTENSAGGTYVLEVDWSNDGVTADETEVKTISANTPLEFDVANRFAKFRVKNTHVSAAFSAHHTSVVGRQTT